MENCVIVPVDDSHRSLDALIAGQALAGQLGLRLHLVSVVARQDEVGARRNAICDAIEELDADITVLADAAPAEALLRVLGEGSGNVCCMATHARGAISEMALGSVARQIVQRHDGPVVLVGPRHARKWRGPIGSVLVCVDGSPLSEQALAPAAGFAARLKATLQLTQVLEPEAARMSDNGDTGEWVYLRRLHDQLRHEQGIGAEWEVLHGNDPADAITSYADAQPGALIVLTSHGRSGLNRLVMGSVAQSIVRASASPVWIVRPQSA
ncbi:MAG TPA: universal stress protein [Rhodocyclaceae bacterium]|nr:universal stress protein [Rhodocyclaceae bacterium]